MSAKVKPGPVTQPPNQTEWEEILGISIAIESIAEVMDTTTDERHAFGLTFAIKRLARDIQQISGGVVA